MSYLHKTGRVAVDGSRKEQTMSGFGVNINSKYWADGKLLPVMELLVNDLGARLYRVDVYGRSDWIDETGALGKEKALTAENLEAVYGNGASQSGWAMMRYLNENGIEPYVTCSGIVPAWMLGDDGVTLTDYESFTEMLISFIDRARNREEIRFSLFGPLNETDIGAPEGPTVSPEGYVEICATLDRKLKDRGWDDIKLVVAEQAIFNADYIKAFAERDDLADRIGVFGMHMYGEIDKELFEQARAAVRGPYKGKPLWMTEYGDLDQTGEKEWYVAWKSAERAMSFIQAGFNGGLQWDACDNYHDHDGAWTIYGLIRYARFVFTPKKRYYGAKQIYRFVRPGFIKVAADCNRDDVQIAAFVSPDEKEMTVVGMNHALSPCEFAVSFKNLPHILEKPVLRLYTTTAQDNCVKQPDLTFYCAYGGTDSKKLDFVRLCAPAESIFTLTSIAD